MSALVRCTSMPSSVIRRFAYDEMSGELWVEFTTGRRYVYSDVPHEVADAFRASGMDPAVELIAGGDCMVRSHAIIERGDELLVVGGGDGTISAAASALVGTKTTLGILPLGTLNHFARDLGIPSVLEDAAQLIGRRSQKRVDVAEMNERLFINNSAIGLYPLMVVRSRPPAA